MAVGEGITERKRTDELLCETQLRLTAEITRVRYAELDPETTNVPEDFL